MSCPWRLTYSDKLCGSSYVGANGYCKEHDTSCLNCGEHSDHGCDHCGQFVCGYPACNKCGMCSVEHGADKHRNKKYRDAELKKKLTALRNDPDLPSGVYIAVDEELRKL